MKNHGELTIAAAKAISPVENDAEYSDSFVRPSAITACMHVSFYLSIKVDSRNGHEIASSWILYERFLKVKKRDLQVHY